MEYGILGPLRVEDQGRLTHVPGTKERGLLGLLIVEAGTVVSADRMIYELWGDDPPAKAPATLRTYVSRLRRAIGAGHIVTHKPGYVLAVGAEQIDAGRFERLADQLEERGLDPETSARIARTAEGEWRGRALVDLEGFPFAEAEARRLEQRRLRTLELGLEAELGLGRHAEVVSQLTALTIDHPFHERFWELLMLALYRSGRAGEALEVFRRAEQELGEQLGIAPSPALRAVERAIVLQDPDLDLVVTQVPHNLPVAVTEFVGRTRELEALDDVLHRSRLVTLTGVGGGGKSRLALELAWRCLSRFPDGVWRIELAALRDPAAVPVAVSATLGEPGSHAEDPVETLAAYLSDRRVLLVLDNCEHLLEGCADLVDRLVARCPRLSFLLTSREPLRIPGETVWLVPPLALPDPSDPVDLQEEAEAFVMFRRRAEAALASFTVTDGNRPDIVSLCRHLAGLPLAIELAAARSAAFTPGQLVERLSEGLDVLEAGAVVHERSRTMRGSLAWSYRLLDEPTATLFYRLAVFVGGWHIDDATMIVGLDRGDTVAGIGALVDVARRARRGTTRKVPPARTGSGLRTGALP